MVTRTLDVTTKTGVLKAKNIKKFLNGLANLVNIGHKCKELSLTASFTGPSGTLEADINEHVSWLLTNTQNGKEFSMCVDLKYQDNYGKPEIPVPAGYTNHNFSIYIDGEVDIVYSIVPEEKYILWKEWTKPTNKLKTPLVQSSLEELPMLISVGAWLKIQTAYRDHWIPIEKAWNLMLRRKWRRENNETENRG